MWSENGFIADVRGKLIENKNARIDDAYTEGYNEAAGICLGILKKKLDGLIGQIKSGPLSDKEQFLLLSLDEVKSDTEVALRGFCDQIGSE